MSGRDLGLEQEIAALREVLARLLRDEGDLSRLVAGAARLTTAIVQAERLQHQLSMADEEEY